MDQSGGYKLIREAGGGLAGPVWVGEGPTGRVAMRRFVSDAIPDSEEWLADRAFFLLAGRSALTLKHKRIVAVTEVLEEESDVWIAMEYVADDTLGSLLAREKLTVEQASYMLRQMALALDHAHQNGVAHGDLKPSNIFVGPKRSIRITDFAVSPRARRHPRGVLDPGRVHPYISPEHLIAPALIGPKSDIYSLGAVAYHMFTGKAPFHSGVSPNAGSDPGPAILRGQLTPASLVNSSLPEVLDGPLSVALSRDPGKRYSSCIQFVDALEAATITTASVAAVKQKPVGPSPRLMYAGIGSLLLACGVAAALMITGGKKAGGTVVTTQPAAQVQTSAVSPVDVKTTSTPAVSAKGRGATPVPPSTSRSGAEEARVRPNPFPPPILADQPPRGSAPPPKPSFGEATAVFQKEPPPHVLPPSPVPIALKSTQNVAPPLPISMEGVPKGFSMVVLSRNKPIVRDSSFGVGDQVLGEMGPGDLKVLVRVNGPSVKGRLSVAWTIDGTVMDLVGVNPNTIAEYRNQPSSGTYRLILRQDTNVVAEFPFRITP